MAERVKTMKRRKPLVDLRRAVIDWLNLDNTAAQWGERADAVKVLLRDIVLPSQGTQDDAGHYWHTFDEPIEDPSGKGDVVGVKAEHRVSKTLDSDAAERFLKRKGLWEACTETVVVISEDAILAANFEGRITDRELNSLYNVKESYAWVPQRRGHSR